MKMILRYTRDASLVNFSLNMMNCVLKMTGFVSEMKNFVLN